MTPDLNLDTVALGVLAFLLTYLLHSTLLLGGVWTVAKLGWLRRAATEDTLWKVALVGGLATASLVTVTGLTPLGGRLTLGDAAPAAMVAGSAADAVAPAHQRRTATPHQQASQRFAARSQSLTAQHVALWSADVAAPRPRPALKRQAAGTNVVALSGELSQGREPIVVSDGVNDGVSNRVELAAAGGGLSWSWPQSWPWLACGLWALLMVVGIARSLWLRRRLNGVLRQRSAVVDPALVGCLERLCAQAGLSRPVRLSCSPFLNGPVALGRWEICLPLQALSELSPAGQEAMLAHELAHLLRRDPAWLALCQLIEACFFFQPLNRLGRRRLQATAEFLCDDWAVATTGRRVAFAECLAQVASWIEARPFRPRLPAAVPGMARSDSALVQRVQRLAGGARDGVLHRGWLALLCLVVLGAVSCGVPTVSASDDESLFDRLLASFGQALSNPSQVERAQAVMRQAAAAQILDEVPDVTEVSEVPEVPEVPDEDEPAEPEFGQVELSYRGDIGVEVSGSGLSALTVAGRTLLVRHEGKQLLLLDEDTGVTLAVERLELSGSDGELTLSLLLSQDDLEQAEQLGLWHEPRQGEQLERDFDRSLEAIRREYERALAFFENQQQRTESQFEREIGHAEREFARAEAQLRKAREQEQREVSSEFEQEQSRQLREARRERQSRERALEQAARDHGEEGDAWDAWLNDWDRSAADFEDELDRSLEQLEVEFEAVLEEFESNYEQEAEAWADEWDLTMAQAEWEFEQAMEDAELEFEQMAEELELQSEALERWFETEFEEPWSDCADQEWDDCDEQDEQDERDECDEPCEPKDACDGESPAADDDPDDDEVVFTGPVLRGQLSVS